MKKTFKFFAAALAIVAAASCAKEISNDNIPVEEEVPVTFTASYDEEDGTKATLAENNFVHWTDEDAIYVYINDSYGDLYSTATLSIDPSSNDVDPTFAAFTGNLIYNGSYSYYAVTPSTGWSFTQMRYDSGLGVQNAVKDSFDPAKHVAVADKARKATYDHFTFHNACALLKVTLASDNVYSIKVEGTNNSGVGIGGKLYFSASDISSKNYAISNMADGDYPYITLKNSNSTPLENGASYYIVVPHITVKNFKVSLCDANGNALVTKSKASDFKIERNKIYDLGTFELPKESVEVSTSSLSLAAKNASASFKVVADVDWTVTSSANWLTVSPSSGSATSGTTINVTASDNTTDYARTATLTIKGKTLTRTVSVTQAKRKTYRTGNRITRTTDLWGGTNYIVKLNSNDRYLWVNNGDKLAIDYTTTYTEDHVFTFVVAGSPSDPSGYSSDKSGRFMSIKTGKLIDANLNITVTEYNLSNALIFYLGSQWGSETGYDIDIYKNGTSETLYRNGYTLGWTTAGGNNDNRKWAIYEAIEN